MAFYIGIGSVGSVVSRKRVAALHGDQSDLIVFVTTWDRPVLTVDKDHESLNFTLLWWELEFVLAPVQPFHRRRWAQETVWRFLAGGTEYEGALDMDDQSVSWPPERAALQRAYRRIRFLWSYRFQI
jgi:hypothetical protein